MKLLVMSDAHITKEDATNTYWCRTAVHGYDFWKRYLLVFDEVIVVARVQHLKTVNKLEYTVADGKGIRYIELPFIRGAKQYLFRFLHLRKLMRQIVTDEDCGIFRLPSLPTFMLLEEFKKTGRPYAIEVIVDPENAYKHNFVARVVLKRKLEKECLIANGVSYVTQYCLEKKYPSHSLLYGKSEKYFDSYYSSINLESSFFGSIKTFRNLNTRAIKIIHVASSINSDVKGHTTLLKMVKILKDLSIPTILYCIGDGDKRLYYENLSRKLRIDENVRFLGLFSKKNELRSWLVNCDIMVFPTQAEGLPRVIIEAMAVGLPCLSTPINGIPELLDSKYLFNPYKPEDFATEIAHLYSHPEELQEMSTANIKKASEYLDTLLQIRRNEFYRRLSRLVLSQYRNDVKG